jgi:hypothetical protein
VTAKYNRDVCENTRTLFVTQRGVTVQCERPLLTGLMFLMGGAISKGLPARGDRRPPYKMASCHAARSYVGAVAPRKRK